jgi:AcrR family transcriptional regulator
MKEATRTRPYRQRRRAADAEAKTQRVLEAALELFAERPFDQITLAAVAERAGVGLQTLIRRVQTKDGLVRAVNAWIHPQVAAAMGEPDTADPRAVADAMARHNERWGALIDRTLRQEDSSPALAEGARVGREGHRAWIEAAFAGPLTSLPPAERRLRLARLVAVTGVELWLVLRRDHGLSAPEARDAVADLITASLPPDPDHPEP